MAKVPELVLTVKRLPGARRFVIAAQHMETEGETTIKVHTIPLAVRTTEGEAIDYAYRTISGMTVEVLED